MSIAKNFADFSAKLRKVGIYSANLKTAAFGWKFYKIGNKIKQCFWKILNKFEKFPAEGCRFSYLLQSYEKSSEMQKVLKKIWPYRHK